MIWILLPTLPLFASLITGFTKLGNRYSGIIFLIASVPAIWLGVVEENKLSLDWLLLGTEFYLDEPRRIFLLLTGILWGSSGLFAGSYLRGDPRKKAFFSYYGFAMAGNFGLLVSVDVASFYTFFSIMSLASYGLVIHNQNPKAITASRIYIVMAILGELFIISALFLAVHTTGTMLLADIPPALAIAHNGSFIFTLALAGFGVKAGAIPLYFWLPLAHPAAPAPASAVLSGAMIKAGLVGWIHFAPIGLVAWEGMSLVMVSLGFASALGAVILGLFQVDPKTNLAYSSISQMGIMTAFLGMGLMGNITASVLLPAIALYACNHGLAKGLLFLGTALPAKLNGRLRILMWCGLGLGALAIAGSPLTGGFWTKYIFKNLLTKSSIPAEEIFFTLLILSSIATTLLLSRFLYLLTRIKHPQENNSPAILYPWVLLLLFVGLWTLSPNLLSDEWKKEILGGSSLADIFQDPYLVGSSVWPILLALGAVFFATTFPIPLFKKLSTKEPIIPPGDFLYIFLYIIKFTEKILEKSIASLQTYILSVESLERILYRVLDNKKTILFSNQIENILRRWEVVGIFFFIFFLTLIISLQ